MSQKMQLWLLLGISFSITMKTSCTDLFAVYNGHLHMVKNADGAPSNIETTKMDLPIPLSFPVAIAHDMQKHRLFVADVFSEDGSIFVINLSKEHTVLTMKAIYKSDASLIENMIFDPRTSTLYWTDSSNVGLWKMEVPESLTNLKKPVRVHGLEHLKQPRGLSLDFCKENLYLTERAEDVRQIEVFNLNTSHREIFGVAKESGIHFEALNVDLKNSELIWAETNESGCSLITSDLLQASEEKVHLELEHCSPFSMAHDDKYIYWSDWEAHGILRTSKSNPKDIEKLVENIPMTSKEGYNLRHFGLTTLTHTVESISNICSQTLPPSIHKPGSGSKASPQSKRKNNDEEANPVKNSEQAKNETKVLTLPEDQETEASGLAESKKTKDSRRIEGKETKASKQVEDKTEASTLEVVQTQVSRLAEEERTSTLADTSYDLQEYSTSGPTPRSNIRFVPLQSVKASISKGIGLENGETLNKLPSACIDRCPDNLYQIPVIVSLTVTCVIFMLSTVFLAVQYYRRVPRQPVRPHFPRKFGPKRRLPVNKPAFCHVDDGVRIDIEDCCQMTVCETPCYTTVKREDQEGKRNSKGEEVKVLLDDCYVPDF